MGRPHRWLVDDGTAANQERRWVCSVVTFVSTEPISLSIIFIYRFRLPEFLLLVFYFISFFFRLQRATAWAGRVSIAIGFFFLSRVANARNDPDTLVVGFLLDFNHFCWVLLGFTGFYWVLLGFTGFSSVSTLLCSAGFQLVLFSISSFTWFNRILLGFARCYWVLLGFPASPTAHCCVRPVFSWSYSVFKVWLGFTGFYWVLVGILRLFLVQMRSGSIKNHLIKSGCTSFVEYPFSYLISLAKMVWTRRNVCTRLFSRFGFILTNAISIFLTFLLGIAHCSPLFAILTILLSANPFVDCRNCPFFNIQSAIVASANRAKLDATSSLMTHRNGHSFHSGGRNVSLENEPSITPATPIAA